MIFKQEINVHGEFARGVIKINNSTNKHMAFLDFDIPDLRHAISAEDILTFAYELINVADEVDKMNGVKGK